VLLGALPCGTGSLALIYPAFYTVASGRSVRSLRPSTARPCCRGTGLHAFSNQVMAIVYSARRSVVLGWLPRMARAFFEGSARAGAPPEHAPCAAAPFQVHDSSCAQLPACVRVSLDGPGIHASQRPLSRPPVVPGIIKPVLDNRSSVPLFMRRGAGWNRCQFGTGIQRSGLEVWRTTNPLRSEMLFSKHTSVGSNAGSPGLAGQNTLIRGRNIFLTVVLWNSGL